MLVAHDVLVRRRPPISLQGSLSAPVNWRGVVGSDLRGHFRILHRDIKPDNMMLNNSPEADCPRTCRFPVTKSSSLTSGWFILHLRSWFCNFATTYYHNQQQLSEYCCCFFTIARLSAAWAVQMRGLRPAALPAIRSPAGPPEHPGGGEVRRGPSLGRAASEEAGPRDLASTNRPSVYPLDLELPSICSST